MLQPRKTVLSLVLYVLYMLSKNTQVGLSTTYDVLLHLELLEFAFMRV
jgi:hypothetical protein